MTAVNAADVTIVVVNIVNSGCCCLFDFVAVVALSNCLLTRMAMALGQRTNFYA